jgi:hypothetical protein
MSKNIKENIPYLLCLLFPSTFPLCSFNFFPYSYSFLPSFPQYLSFPLMLCFSFSSLPFLLFAILQILEEEITALSGMVKLPLPGEEWTGVEKDLKYTEK